MLFLFWPFDYLDLFHVIGFLQNKHVESCMCELYERAKTSNNYCFSLELFCLKLTRQRGRERERERRPFVLRASFSSNFVRREGKIEMGTGSQDATNRFKALMDQVEEPLKTTYQNVHQGYHAETLARFLKAREWNVIKAHKMLVDCLRWRVQNDIDNILTKPIIPTDMYRAVRDSQLIGMSGYSREGLPVFAHGVGLSTFDKASVHYYVQSHIQINEYRDRIVLPTASRKYGRPITTCVKVLDMTGLKLSALNQIKLMTIISTIDDMNYPEKTNTYYIVNAPYIFSACWKVVKPLLQERTRKKVQVLSGNGRDELLKIMDAASLPHFCKREGSGSSRHSEYANENCFSLDHPFHQQLYNYIKQQSLASEPTQPIKQGSVHVDLPEPAAEGTEIAKTIESEMRKFENGNGLPGSLDGHKINDNSDYRTTHCL